MQNFKPGQSVLYGNALLIMVEQCGYLSTVFYPKEETFHILCTLDLKPILTVYSENQLVTFESRLFKVFKIEPTGTIWITEENGMQIIRVKDSNQLKPVFA